MSFPLPLLPFPRWLYARQNNNQTPFEYWLDNQRWYLHHPLRHIREPTSHEELT